MIQRLSYIESNTTSPKYNLAMEEYLLLHCLSDECILYLWQNEHTVVIGKNQNAWKECNISKLEEEKGTIVRRLSGGGSVYHDLGNLNFTFITSKENYDVQKQSEVILRAVQKLGIHAEKSGRNDLLVEGKKFSGHAYYKQKGFCYHHGTIMVEVDVNALSRYLNVSKEKLKAKGVQSVKSRVCNLKDFNKDIDIPSLKEALKSSFEEVYHLKINEKILESKKEIEELKNKYASKQWTLGENVSFSNEISKRFIWGDISIHFNIENQIIKDVSVYSDAMETDLANKIKESLDQCKYDKKEILTQISEIEVEELYKKDLCEWILTIEF